MQSIVDQLKDVTLHNDFPVKVFAVADGTEVFSGCDEVTRSAFVKPSSAVGKFLVTTYLDANAISEGPTVSGEYKKPEAMNLAKDFVATGKIPKSTDSATKKRGRPPKGTTETV